MDFLPIFINLKKQSCLVVGAGKVAAGKIDLLLKAGATITVIAKSVNPGVMRLTTVHPSLTVIEKTFETEDLKSYRLVISATNDPETNKLVASAAKQRGILVNVVDNPELCSFIFPAIIDRFPIIAAISSGGVSPVLARLLRAKIETVLPPAYGQLASLAEKFRLIVKQQLSNSSERRIFWEEVFQGSIAEQVFSGNIEYAEQQLLKKLEVSRNTVNTGEVYIIGAGPGVADLLTFRALRLMQQADVVVYDRLVSNEVLELARRDSEKIYVGKQRNNHTLPQEKINSLLIELALSGKRVARLKGGDPFIFGRGGEEIEILVQHGISFQVVPGITAATGCASYAGIPLTHRDYAQSCTFVTGHLKNGEINLNWKQLVQTNQTIVIYMGLMALEKICTALIANGSAKDLPIALIQNGTCNNQTVVTGTLESIGTQVLNLSATAPTLIIIGTVVKLRKQLNWFQGVSDKSLPR
jgi:uroporphyrin-III C-methyltransferase/precorrin-2 dehydrogenase/sirohydrochlorin ferrochelatase